MEKNEKINSISLDGGTPCFHFINTVHNWVDEVVPDYLLSPIDVVMWAKKAKIINGALLTSLESWTLSNPKHSEQGLIRTKALREVMHKIFYAISHQKRVNPNDLEKFNGFLSDLLPSLRINFLGGVFVDKWEFSEKSFDCVLGPVVKDAYDLLLSNKLSRIKNCPNCGWIFLDNSKNSSRRWCSMKSCGSNVKALDWYYRHKKALNGDF